MDVRLEDHLPEDALDYVNTVLFGELLLVFPVGKRGHLHFAGLVELEFAQLDRRRANIYG